jgi:hypothetical protein
MELPWGEWWVLLGRKIKISSNLEFSLNTPYKATVDFFSGEVAGSIPNEIIKFFN